MARQRAHRAFTTDAVDDELLDALLTAAGKAPSAYNSQPWEWVVVRDPATRVAIGDVAARLWRAVPTEWRESHLERSMAEDVSEGAFGGIAVGTRDRRGVRRRDPVRTRRDGGVDLPRRAEPPPRRDRRRARHGAHHARDARPGAVVRPRSSRSRGADGRHPDRLAGATARPASPGSGRVAPARGALVSVPGPVPARRSSPLRRARLARVDHRDPHRQRKVAPWVDRLAWTLDESIPLPGGHRTGLDGVVGLIPGIGDLAGFAAGMVVVIAGAAADVSVPTLVRMLWHTTVTAVVGVVPFAGDLFAIAYKPNMRNIRLIHADLDDRSRTRRRSLWVLLAIVAAFAVTILGTIALVVWLFVALVEAIVG